MQLVKRRPITLPVFKSGKWYDDFAVTGASDSRYILLYGAKDKLSDGIRLRATAAKSSVLYLPLRYKVSNFEAEVICKRIAGAEILPLVFRYTDATNFWYIWSNNTTEIKLVKIVAGVYTTVGTISGYNLSDSNRLGVRAVGSNIEVFVNGVRILNIVDSDNIAGNRFDLEVYDATIGVAQGDWQYVAIKPL